MPCFTRSVTPIWLPFVTFVCGIVVTFLVEEVRHRHIREREREARAAETAAKRDESTRAFQRDTLVALQAALAKLARATGAAYHHTEMTYRESGAWGRDPLPDSVDQAFTAAITEVNRLKTQVADDGVRQAVGDFTSTCTDAVMPGMRGEPDDTARARCEAAFGRASESTPVLKRRDRPSDQGALLTA
jgi:hypothetical protein